MLGFSNPDGVDKVVLAAPAYYAIKDAYGLPSDDPAELAAAPPVLAKQADRVLVVGFPLGFADSSRGDASDPGRPRRRRARCRCRAAS